MMAPWRRGGLDQSGQWRDVAIHGEYAVGDEQFAAGLGFELAQDAVRLRRRPCAGKTWIFACDRRQPSMMLAWFSASEMMWSSGVRMAATVPALAAKPDWKTTHASTFLNAAMRRSSSMWMLMVPAIVRTAPEPAP